MRSTLSLLSKTLCPLARKSNTLRIPLKFHFSKGESLTQRSQERLLRSIKNEIDHEEEESTTRNDEVDDSISTFIKDNNWTFKLDPNSTRIKMDKKTGDFNVSVFTSVKPAEQENDQSEDKDSENRDQDNEDEINDDEKYLELLVTINKAGKSESLVIDILSFNGEIMINNFYTSADPGAAVNSRLTFSQTEAYTGPQFDSLDEKLQSSTVNFLKSLGIDSEFCKFLEDTSYDLEQRFYVSWLEDIRNFLE